MIELLYTIVLGIMLLFSVIMARALRLSSKQTKVDHVDDIMIDSKEIADHLKKAIQFQTISHQDKEQFDSREFYGLHSYLEQTFPKVHSILKKEVVGEYSLLYTWKGKEEDKKPILFMAHMDVVPVEPGTEDDWTYPPFEGLIAEGYIWGRGTLDFKVGLIGILEAVETLLCEGFHL